MRRFAPAWESARGVSRPSERVTELRRTLGRGPRKYCCWRQPKAGLASARRRRPDLCGAQDEHALNYHVLRRARRGWEEAARLFRPNIGWRPLCRRSAASSAPGAAGALLPRRPRLGGDLRRGPLRWSRRRGRAPRHRAWCRERACSDAAGPRPLASPERSHARDATRRGHVRWPRRFGQGASDAGRSNACAARLPEVAPRRRPALADSRQPAGGTSHAPTLRPHERALPAADDRARSAWWRATPVPAPTTTATTRPTSRRRFPTKR